MRDLELAKANVILYVKKLRLGTATQEELFHALERYEECEALLRPRRQVDERDRMARR